MGWFSRSPQMPLAAPQAPVIDLGQALEIALVKSVESNGAMATKLSELMVAQFGALAESFAQLAPRRRSHHKKRDPKTGRMISKKAVDCALCGNAAYPNPTPDMIRAHINHENPGMNYRVEDGAVHVDADVATIQTDAEGNQVVECPDCAKGIDHSHGTN